jgi:hypothetical protein
MTFNNNCLIFAWSRVPVQLPMLAPQEVNVEKMCFIWFIGKVYLVPDLRNVL